MIRVDGVLWDIPDASHNLQRYSPEQRANHRASHRLGHQQRERIGEVFWTHPLVPERAFPTRKAARLAALKTLALQEEQEKP